MLQMVKGRLFVYLLKNDKKDVIKVDCTNWSEELIFDDNLRIDLMTNEFDNWLSYKAYK